MNLVWPEGLRRDSQWAGDAAPHYFLDRLSDELIQRLSWTQISFEYKHQVAADFGLVRTDQPSFERPGLFLCTESLIDAGQLGLVNDEHSSRNRIHVVSTRRGLILRRRSPPGPNQRIAIVEVLPEVGRQPGPNSDQLAVDVVRVAHQLRPTRHGGRLVSHLRSWLERFGVNRMELQLALRGSAVHRYGEGEVRICASVAHCISSSSLAR